MKSYYYIALLTLTVFLLLPLQIYACNSKSEKTETSHNKQSDSGMEKVDCCDLEKKLCDKHGKDCNGKCGSPDCHCPTINTNFTIPFFAQPSQVKILLRSPKFYYCEAFHTSSIHSIWLPPKIS